VKGKGKSESNTREELHTQQSWTQRSPAVLSLGTASSSLGEAGDGGESGAERERLQEQDGEGLRIKVHLRDKVRSKARGRGEGGLRGSVVGKAEADIIISSSGRREWEHELLSRAEFSAEQDGCG
jgi:hypothetical protein